MLAALASAALIAAGSLALGQAILFAGGARDWSWLAGPVGLAALLCVSAIVAGFGGRGAAIAIVDGLLLAGSVFYLGARGGGHGWSWPALGAAGLAALAAAIPFIAAGAVGILGVGLVNDDMANHLLLADWIDERFRPQPVLVDQGYPLGPHALVAGLSSALHASSIDVFAGLVLAIPALTALVAYGALDGLRTPVRIPVAALVALPYLAAAYLAQEAFKEPVIALFVLAFALLLPRADSWRAGLPLGVLAAGTVYVYSFPGLAWLLGTGLAFGALRRSWPPKGTAPAIAAGVGALVVLCAPEVGRLLDFADFRALDPDRANDGGLGNLPGHVSPLEALGIWPTSDFRTSASAASAPAIVFYAAGAAALLGLALAAPRWVRRHGAAIPAALLAAAVIYVAARAFGTVYSSAKALAIAAPLITLMTLGGLLAAPSRALRLGGAALAIAAAASSFLLLRQAPVAPEDHMDELAEIRPLVTGEKLLFLGRDNFVLYELRGSRPFVTVRNFYDPYYAGPHTELAGAFQKFDFDTVDAATLAEFPFVLTTRAAYASGPPPGYSVLRQTESYVLWARRGGATDRLPAERDAAPGRLIDCDNERFSGARTAIFAQQPVVDDGAGWSQTTLEDGSQGRIELVLPRGSWSISLQYDATREVDLRLTTTNAPASATLAALPANLDFRGPGPYWPAGEIQATAPQTRVVITASVAEPPLAGRLLGADAVAHLGPIAASPAGRGYVAGGESPLPGDGELLRRGDAACGGYVDWIEARR